MRVKIQLSVNSVNLDTFNINTNKALANGVSDTGIDNSVFSLDSISANSAEERGSVNSWINEKIGYKTGCTDSKDDGKLSFGDKLKSMGRGALNFVTNIVEAVKEKPVQTLLTVGATIVGSALLVGAGIISAPALAIGGAAIGLGFGAVKIGQGIAKASEAETDAEAKLAYESIGEGGATVTVSALTMGKGIKTYKEGLSTARTSAAESAKSAQKSANNAAKSASKANEAVNSATQSAESASTSVTTAKNAANSAAKIAADFTDDAIKQSSTLAENAAQNARSASKTAQEALTNTKNSAGMTTTAAGDAAQYAKEASNASQKANETWSLLRARKASQAGAIAADSAKLAAADASGYAQAAQMYATNTAGAAEIAASSATDAIKHLDNAAAKSLEYWVPDNEEVHVFGYDGSGSNRDLLRYQMSEDYDLWKTKLFDDLNAMEDIKIQTPRTEEGVYGKLSKPRVNKKGEEWQIFKNIAELDDLTSVRGKTPLSGKAGDINFKVKKLADSGIKRIIDLRAEGECSQRGLDACKNAGVEYLNFPVEDKNWTAQCIQKLPEFVDTINKKHFYIGCANGQARTDLATAVNYVFNPSSGNVPRFYYGSAGSSRISIQGNITQILNNISPETIKQIGWSDVDLFYQTANTRLQQIVSSIK